MEYPNIGYRMPADKAALDDELYTITKKLKFGHGKWVTTVLVKVNELIAAGADLNQTGRPRGPLLAVILSSNMTDEKEAIFRTILEHGADPKATVSGLSTYVAGQRVNYTSLGQLAVSERMLPTTCCRLITLLAKHGADLNAKTRNGCTALDIAMYRLWEWEERFDFQRTAGANGSYNSEMETGFVLLAYMPPFWKLVETVIRLGGFPSLWTEAQVNNCRERLARIHHGCLDAREKGFAKAEASGMEPEHYFSTTPLGDDVGSFARMDVGEPTPRRRQLGWGHGWRLEFGGGLRLVSLGRPSGCRCWSFASLSERMYLAASAFGPRARKEPRPTASIRMPNKIEIAICCN